MGSGAVLAVRVSRMGQGLLGSLRVQFARREGLPATHFLIPFKRRAGEKVSGRGASRRATAYDVTDLSEWVATLTKEGCELGVHGIDAWHSVTSGRDELAQVAGARARLSRAFDALVAPRHEYPIGLREGWLQYDATAGYNETIGYRNGTGQVSPSGNRFTSELPLHIQDGALFYPQQLDLSESEAEARCQRLLDHARVSGGELTLLWHDRSHGPERFWGEFYATLVERLKASGCWFGTAEQVVDWFRKRRKVQFASGEDDGRVKTLLTYDGEEINPPLVVRLYRRPADQDAQGARAQTTRFVDVAWSGAPLELSGELVA